MRIYSMTASFGKLEHQTLTLEPGLNIIQAPNEWGKSTWCAFLAAMLYGIDTRVRTTKASLADKERYAPWSGSPMSGSIDLNWKGRDITIQRQTKGRTPMGQFRAYETATGLPVPELTAENCGKMLLGVERSVFVRAGFIRLTDLPVTQDDALRHRLNALVTTGDDSGTADALSKKLNTLKNRIRFNRTGLLPQAEAQRADLIRKLQELEQLQAQKDHIKKRKNALVASEKELKNHRISLAYHAAQENAARISAAEAARDQAAEKLKELEDQRSRLPSQEEAAGKLAQLQALFDQWNALPAQTAETAVSPTQAAQDAARHRKLCQKVWLVPLLFALIPAFAGIGLCVYDLPWWPAAVLCGVSLVTSLTVSILRRGKRKKLERRYGSSDPAQWLAEASAQARDRDQRETLTLAIMDAAEGTSLPQAITHWQQVLDIHNAYLSARQAFRQADGYVQALKAVAAPPIPPEFPDRLSFSASETARLLEENVKEQQQLQLQLGQAIGRMEQIGDSTSLKRQLDAVSQRIASLEQTYEALVLAQNTLDKATAQLQQRFAPALTRQAKDLFSRMTGGRYDRLTLDQDLTLRTAGAREDTLLSAGWRSDGTADQLYLALRLAVAQVLTPHAPLVLDDALVRFDNQRLKSALEILSEAAQEKQVLLFTCQSREAEILYTSK